MNQKPPVLLGLKDTQDLLMAKSPKNLSRVQREVAGELCSPGFDASRIKLKSPLVFTCGDLIQPCEMILCVSREDLKLCLNMKNARRQVKQEMLAGLHS